MLKLMPKTIHSRGDTIVEVMVVLAVLGLAISISYATANRSLLDTRQAQENSQATELVQDQVEALRVLAPTPTTDPNYATKDIFQPSDASHQPYCIEVNTGNYQVIPPTSAIYAADCQNQLGLYNLTDTYTPDVANDGGTFTVIATWPDIEGQGNDTVTIFYNLYKPTP